MAAEFAADPSDGNAAMELTPPSTRQNGRRRLAGKQSPIGTPYQFVQGSVLPLVDHDEPYDVAFDVNVEIKTVDDVANANYLVLERWWKWRTQNPAVKALKQKVTEIAHNTLRRCYRAHQTSLGKHVRKNWQDKRTAFHAEFKRLSQLQKRDYCLKLSSTIKVSPLAKRCCILKYCTEAQSKSSNVEEESAFWFSKFGLLTYNSEKLHFDRNILPAATTVEAFEQSLRDCVQVRSVWVRATEDLQAMVAQIEPVQYSLGLEVCAQTLTPEHFRLHMHLVLSFPTRKCIKDKETFKLFDIVPSHAKTEGMCTTSHRASNTGALHYYVQFPKLGSLFVSTNHNRYRDFVNPHWATRYLQAGKIDH